MNLNWNHSFQQLHYWLPPTRQPPLRHRLMRLLPPPLLPRQLPRQH
jgi:hypothetical protein